MSLEIRLARLFAAKGYVAAHNVLKTGRSGNSHQIDVYAEYRAPLHVSALVIESKAHVEPIDKDVVMKLLSIVDDLGADRGILASSSGFTPSAIKTAVCRNVELWDRDTLIQKLGELDLIAVEGAVVAALSPESHPLLQIRRAISRERMHEVILRSVEKRRKGGLFGFGAISEELTDLEESHYPFYELELECSVVETERRGLLKTEIVGKHVPTGISLDAVTGELVSVADNSIRYSYGALCGLSRDEIHLLTSVATRSFDKNSLAATGMPASKSQKIISSLIGKDVVSVHRGERGSITYQSKVSIPDPRKLRSIGEAYNLDPVSSRSTRIPCSVVDSSTAIHTIELLWPTIRIERVSTIHYPVFVVSYARSDGTKRIEVFDAVSGQRMDNWSARLRPDDVARPADLPGSSHRH